MKSSKHSITTARAAEQLGMTRRNVIHLCQAGKIAGAVKFQRDWVVPDPPRLLGKRYRKGAKKGGLNAPALAAHES